MSMLQKILLIAVFVILVSIAGCAVHAETSMGAGTGSKYAASMSNRRGAGTDWPANAENISSKSSKNITRAARD